MKINNKYSIGEKVFYPAANMAAPSLLESTIVGINVMTTESGLVVSYRTEASHVAQEHIARQPAKAKRILLKMIADKKKELAEQIEGIEKEVKNTKPKELVKEYQTPEQPF